MATKREQELLWVSDSSNGGKGDSLEDRISTAIIKHFLQNTYLVIQIELYIY